MKKLKRARLERRGWKIGSAEEFLGLSAEEAAYVEMKLALSEKLKEHRLRKRITQTELAKLLRSTGPLDFLGVTPTCNRNLRPTVPSNAASAEARTMAVRNPSREGFRWPFGATL